MNGYDFKFDTSACETCPGNCCLGESGNVWVNQEEMHLICEFLQIHFVDLIERYLHRVDNRFSCKERVTEQGMECVFFQGQERKCSIYAVRPSGCRSYPFWDYFKDHFEMLVKECPGIVER